MPLHPAIATELIDRRDSHLRSADILSVDKLNEAYVTFRRQFGPDVLARLDGVPLLEGIHLHGNKDSLVYWLEFKNDDEMPGVFGSIAGGSALKFGIYRRVETGKWMTGSPQQQVELTLEEAIERARRHRDELLAGANLLERFQSDGSDEDYQRLQRDLQQAAPSVSDLAWGHKYFSLLYPDKLDDFHAPSYQRYHLIRILQVPPLVEGRYVCAGRFVAVVRELGMPMNHLTSVLVGRNGEPRSYWRIGTRSGDDNIPRQYWPDMRDGGFVALGWQGLGDISDLARQAHNQQTKDEVRRRVAESAEGQCKQTLAAVLSNFAGQIFNFIHIRDGDIVLAGDGATVLGIGRINGEYRYDPSHPFSHRRPVEWLHFGEWKLDPYEGPQRTVHQLKDARNLVQVEQRLLGATPIPLPRPRAGTGVPVARMNSATVPRLQGIPGRIQAVLDRKGQVIAYGPPGTGKTYLAQTAARELAALHAFGCGFDELDDDQRRVVTGNGAHLGLVRAVTFHPAYGYEDFLEGYRPILTRDQMAFERRDGIFKQLCQDADKTPDRRFYLLIDEINRGDIPRIFGELLTLLEKDKRGQTVLLGTSGEPFRVPGNVYVIGTMNTADRSIALLDAALGRRFGFIELMPDSRVLGKASVTGVPLGRWLDALNARIREHAGRDARNLQIGHSYLLEDGRAIEQIVRLAQVLRDDIIPLLEEYTYEDYTALEKILGPGFVDPQRLRIREEVFESAHGSELVQCLLELNPELATVPEAVDVEPVLEPQADTEGDEEMSADGELDLAAERPVVRETWPSPA